MNQERQAIALGYIIARRLNGRTLRRDEMKIDAINASIVTHLSKRARLLATFNGCECNNVKARLNRQLCTLDSTIDKLTQCAQDTANIESHNVRNIKESRIIVKQGKGRKHKRHKVTRLVESVRCEGRLIRVTGTSKGASETMPTYTGNIAPLSYNQETMGTWIQPVEGLTGYNEINPKESA